MSSLLDDQQLQQSYRVKRRYISLAELFLVGIAIVGVWMKWKNLAGDGFILGVSLVALSFLYFPLGIFTLNAIRIDRIFQRSTYLQYPRRQLIFSTVAGFLLFIIVAAITLEAFQMRGSAFLTIVALAGAALLIGYLVRRSLQARYTAFDLALAARVVLGLAVLLLLVVQRLN